jgi:DNA-binding HxlR family transcriptional regulator
MNNVLKLTVKDAMPVRIEYELTDEGKSLERAMEAMGNGGNA